MRLRSSLMALLVATIACTSLTACKPHKRTFGEKVQDTLDPPKGPVEKFGRSVDRATESNN
ncbi:hypothetical protein AA0472_2056 [Acetobacter estunensis NRIC 0472]|uniref:Lipoprotein n=1 Tax=Acetobacter estunensis TaxID=104097 RepID=A0A967EC42_9PROT|nr:hypothetical protein [Acetobacter estunensis]NHO52540.1 hypothetical protein [Acetobacter estunensis]GBQ26265.1 hypothetical protein AA0472_2056 [Acetobacter estunensis NRIC 0472]